MFCEKCGAKNEKSSKFCEACGEPLKKEKQKKEKQPRKPLSKKMKWMIGGITVFLVVVIAVFLILSNLCTPEREAKKYFEAMMNQEIDILYHYVDVKNSKLTSKKVFQEVMEEQLKEETDSKKVMNYKVTKVDKSLDGLYTGVTIRYVLEGSNTSNETTITLAKDKENKFLFFPNWKVQNGMFKCVENNQLKVMAGSKVKIAGVELTKSDLNKKDSSKEFDVYDLPAMFRTEYPVVVEFPFGFEIKTSFTPSSYSRVETIEFDEDDLSRESKDEMTKAIKKNLEIVYNGAIANKSFADIKSDFEYQDGDLKELEKEYNDFKESLNKRSRKLTKISFQDLEIRDLSITEDGMLQLYFKVSYDYEVKYQIGDEEKTSEDDSYMYSYMIFDYKNDYQLIDMNDLNYYFY